MLALAPRVARRALSTSSVRRNATPVSGGWHIGVDVPRGHLPAFARSHPALWASLKAQVPSAIAALGARFHLFPSSLGADDRARRVDLVRIACTHPSIVNVQTTAAALPLAAGERQEVPELREEIVHNAQLATVGNALLGLMATEHFHLKYPHLPTRVLKAFVSAYVGPSTLADVGAELGVLGQGIQRWDRTGSTLVPRMRGAPVPLLSKDVAAQSVRALVAVLFQELGIAATRAFVHSQLLSRRLDLGGLLKFRDPKRVLSATCRKYGKPLPQSRLVAETGRLSIAPVFVVGVWSGTVKLGEGTGSSIRMAEFRAAEDALRRLYLAEQPNHSFVLPSTTLDSACSGVGPLPHSLQNAAELPARTFVPQPLGRSEVLHESRG
jgi:hypothetical protein